MKAPKSSLTEAKAALLAMTEEAAELKGVAGGAITETVADWLAPHYALAARERLAVAEGAERWEILRAFAQDWALLRRGNHQAERLQIEREQLELDRERSKERMQAQFEEWLKQPEIKDRLCGGKLTPEQRERRIREIFGLPEKGRGGISAETRVEIERAMAGHEP